MAYLDPRAKKLLGDSKRFELKIHEVSPEDIEPNGDRYVVEVINLDEKIELGQLLVVTQDPNADPKDPMANPLLEKRGVLAAVIITKGNGHLLGLEASVPMFYEPGDVVLVDANMKGRAIRILGREARIVNQIDILARLSGIRLQRVDDTWEEA